MLHPHESIIDGCSQGSQHLLWHIILHQCMPFYLNCTGMFGGVKPLETVAKNPTFIPPKYSVSKLRSPNVNCNKCIIEWRVVN